MKLTMKNEYSFQAAEGYLDDPEMMSADEVKRQLRYWHSLLENMDILGILPSDLAYLSSFVESLASGEVEYEQPLKKACGAVVDLGGRNDMSSEEERRMSKRYCFTVGTTLHVWAESADDALAKVREGVPSTDVRVAEMELVEQYDPETGEVIA